MRKVLVISICLLLTWPLHAQLFKKRLNRVDENGNRKGKWITYWDDMKKVPMSKATFSNGRETGVSKEYHVNGNLRLKFRHYNDRIRVKYYNTERKLEQKGWSVLEYNAEDTHYYWHGKWKFYDSNRKLQRVAYYENGEEVVPSGI